MRTRALLGWAAAGAAGVLVAVVLHEGAHAVAAWASGFGPSRVSLADGTHTPALDRFLGAADVGQVGGNTRAWRAIAPTWAGWGATYVTWWAAWRLTRPVRRAFWWVRRAAAALGTAAVLRFVVTPWLTLGAAVAGRPLPVGDETRMAAVLSRTVTAGVPGVPRAVWAALLAVLGLAALGTVRGMLRRAVGPGEDWRMAGFFLGVGAVCALAAFRAVPSIVVGR